MFSRRSLMMMRKTHHRNCQPSAASHLACFAQEQLSACFAQAQEQLSACFAQEQLSALAQQLRHRWLPEMEWTTVRQKMLHPKTQHGSGSGGPSPDQLQYGNGANKFTSIQSCRLPNSNSHVTRSCRASERIVRWVSLKQNPRR